MFSSFYIVAFLLSLSSLQSSLHALPVPLKSPAPPSRFMVNSPVDGATWGVGSLRSIYWDSSLMPEDSTIDVAMMHHEQKQSLLVRRYVLARPGSCCLSLPPEVMPGTYSLLLTVYKNRTTVVLGRSLVPIIYIVDKSALKTPPRAQGPPPAVSTGTSSQDRKEARDERTMLSPSAVISSESGGVVSDQETIRVINEAGGKVRVRRAPYTFGWTVPNALRDVPRARADILLVKSGHPSAESDRTVERALATNLNAHSGFYVVLLPMDLRSEEEYQLKIVISGAGRRFVGFSRAFTTTPPAFAE
ncbi:unnamed protein product [Mortierella alpina]